MCRTPPAGGSSRMKRILIVEDNEMNRDVLSAPAAARRGYDVLLAADGLAGPVDGRDATART